MSAKRYCRIRHRSRWRNARRQSFSHSETTPVTRAIGTRGYRGGALRRHRALASYSRCSRPAHHARQAALRAQPFGAAPASPAPHFDSLTKARAGATSRAVSALAAVASIFENKRFTAVNDSSLVSRHARHSLATRCEARSIASRQPTRIRSRRARSHLRGTFSRPVKDRHYMCVLSLYNRADLSPWLPVAVSGEVDPTLCRKDLPV